jgi:hypothetical protein
MAIMMPVRLSSTSARGPAPSAQRPEHGRFALVLGQLAPDGLPGDEQTSEQRDGPKDGESRCLGLYALVDLVLDHRGHVERVARAPGQVGNYLPLDRRYPSRSVNQF